jgi:Sec-independent protein translocase protein TatA
VQKIRGCHPASGTIAPVDILLVLVVILIIVLIWRGPKMLPQFGEALGKAVKGARDNFSRDSDEAEPKAESKDDDSQTTGQ